MLSSRASLCRILSAAMDSQTLASWTSRLTREAEELDFTDSEDRAIFRGRVLRALNLAKIELIQGLASALGVPNPPRNRNIAIRAIADAWIADKK